MAGFFLVRACCPDVVSVELANMANTLRWLQLLHVGIPKQRLLHSEIKYLML